MQLVSGSVAGAAQTFPGTNYSKFQPVWENLNRFICYSSVKNRKWLRRDLVKGETCCAGSHQETGRSYIALYVKFYQQAERSLVMKDVASARL